MSSTTALRHIMEPVTVNQRMQVYEHTVRGNSNVARGDGQRRTRG